MTRQQHETAEFRHEVMAMLLAIMSIAAETGYTVAESTGWWREAIPWALAVLACWYYGRGLFHAIAKNRIED